MTRGNPKPISDRFWSKVAISNEDDCWNWIGGVSANGYGQIKIGTPSRKMEAAHRVCWSIHHGQAPSGMVVMHSCDNRRCVNPRHLSLGTQSANILDAVRKERFPQATRHRALTEIQAQTVKKILAEKSKTHNQIAETFGVARQVITDISRGRTHSKTEQSYV